MSKCHAFLSLTKLLFTAVSTYIYIILKITKTNFIMNLKTIAITLAIVVVGLLAYDVLKKKVFKTAFEAAFEE